MGRTLQTKIPEPASEKDWRGRDDAHTLAQACKIMGDPVRLKNAKKWLSIEVIETQENLKTLLKVEGKLEKQT